jgi:hypothetical protein
MGEGLESWSDWPMITQLRSSKVSIKLSSSDSLVRGFFFSFFLVFIDVQGWGSWTRGLGLTTRYCSTIWITLLTLFALIIFEIGSHFFAKAVLDCNPPICASPCSWDDREIPLCPAIGWDEVSWIFFFELDSNMISPTLTSASWVAGVTGFSHCTQLVHDCFYDSRKDRTFNDNFRFL